VRSAVARSPEDVQRALAARLPPALGERAVPGRLLVARAGDPIFPDDVQVRAASGVNPALAAYAAAGPDARRLDLYLYDLSDDYYPSEYVWRGDTAPFQTDFVVHLEPDGPAGASATRIEVLEYRPRVRLGKTLDLRGHHGPGFYWDIRTVEPTVREREALLALILRLLDPRQDRAHREGDPPETPA
jgi:hypothetical protein